MKLYEVRTLTTCSQRLRKVHTCEGEFQASSWWNLRMFLIPRCTLQQQGVLALFTYRSVF